MSAITTQNKTPTSLLMDEASFNHLWRVGKMLALSPLFPEHLRKGGGDSAVANGVLVMNMAVRLNEDPLTVAQSIYFVGGKPGWSASYMISKANQHGVFTNPIDWEVKGSGDSLSVTAHAELRGTGKRVAVTCDMAMAKKEGWTKNPKYQSMPEQMLRYRSATFLIRLYCPEVMVGVPAAIEVELGMKDVTPTEEAERFAEHTIPAREDDVVEERPEPARTPAQSKPDQESTAPKAQENKAEKPAEAEKRTAQSNDGQESGNGQLPLGDAQESAEPEIDVERFESLVEMILDDLNESGADEVMQMYGPQIEQMANTKGLEALAKRVQDAIDAKK